MVVGRAWHRSKSCSLKRSRARAPIQRLLALGACHQDQDQVVVWLAKQREAPEHCSGQALVVPLWLKVLQVQFLEKVQ